MLVSSVRDLNWKGRDVRLIGVALAIVGVLMLQVRAAPLHNLIAWMSVIVPVVEIAAFAAVVAFCFDDEADRSFVSCIRNVEALVAWCATVFIMAWGNIALVHASIEAYMRIGLPPMWNAPF